MSPTDEAMGFAAASSDLGITPSAVSKVVTRLQDRLECACSTAVPVVWRLHRKAYHLRARDILAAIDDTEAEVSGGRPTPSWTAGQFLFWVRVAPTDASAARFPRTVSRVSRWTSP
jgi:DNA-binding transcriptional LysR family regulator